MTIRICNNGSASPLGVLGWCHDCGRIISQGRKRSINRWNSKTDASAKCGCPVRGKRIKLEHATGKLGCKVLWSAAVPEL